MRLFTFLQYRPVQSSDDDIEKTSSPAQPSDRASLFRSTLGIVIAFALGMVVQYGLLRHAASEFPHELVWRSGLNPELSWIKFRGRLLAESPYRGAPSQAVDNAWARYTDSPWVDGAAVVLGVTEDDMRASRKATGDEWYNSTVRLDERNGGGYMATLEVFHQLHCLNMLRKYTYPDHYPPETFKSGSMLREHVDHCIDMLRQVLMCHADTGLVAFHWVEGKNAAFPDFSTWHKCRNPEAILSWAHAHEANIVHHITKPDGAVEMPGLS